MICNHNIGGLMGNCSVVTLESEEDGRISC